MAQNLRQAKRNTDILRRKICGQSLKEISVAIGDISYGRVVDIWRSERARIRRRSVEDRVPHIEIAKEYQLPESEIQKLVDEESDRIARERERLEADDRLRQDRYESQTYDSNLGALEEFWKPIEECPAYVIEAILFDGTDVFLGSRSFEMVRWIACNQLVKPTHFIRIPAPPKENSVC
ncbi:MAG: hypothetical protein WBG95_05340 [Sulfitobacter sp.]